MRVRSNAIRAGLAALLAALAAPTAEAQDVWRSQTG